MTSAVAIIGFGEAARAFTGDDGWHGRARTFDIKTDDPAQAGAMRQAYAVHDVTGTDTLAACLDGAAAIISLVTADQALGVARDAARLCPPGTFFFDFNSVAPGTKIRAMEAIAAAGGVYVDVAVMSPVNPARLDTPLLVSGADPDGACDHLRSVGFRNVTAVSATVGDASSIKMIRSVMIKGIEALTAECMIAARKAGQPIMDVVPQEDNLVVEAKINVRDIDSVRVGAPAEVQLQAYSRRTLPPLNGEITYVAADQTTNEETGTAFYVVHAEIDKSVLAKHEDVRLYPGMPAEVLVKNRPRRAIDYIIEPITKSFNRAFREE